MKLNRLLEITNILLIRKSVTAAELAGAFGVSTRTIYRDIDVLSTSGIPVYATQGAGGGFSLLEEYTLQRAALTEEEKQNVLYALQALQSTRYPESDKALGKLQALFHQQTPEWVAIDYTRWGSSPDAMNRFTDVKDAILNNRLLEIEYLDSGNRHTTRTIKPLQLIFKSTAWYLLAYCNLRAGNRVFRISRIRSVRVTGELFDRAQALLDAEEYHAQPQLPVRSIHIVLRFTAEALTRLYDDYDEEMIRDNGDGTYTVGLCYPEDDWVYGYILSFGPWVEVLAPLHLRRIIHEKCRKMLGLYEKYDIGLSGMT